MHLRDIEAWVQFVNALDHCTGNVILNSKYGDTYNLKSKLSQLLALNVLMDESENGLELICSNREDDEFLRTYLAA